MIACDRNQTYWDREKKKLDKCSRSLLQATLERLENVFQIQTQQDFVSMTNQANGTVNGHGGFERHD